MTLHYAIRPAHPGAHLFHVTVTVAEPAAEGQVFSLPAWIPGSYMIREFARNIVQVAALAGDERVPVEKLDKHTWRVPALGEGAGPLTLAYEVHAWDLSVRAAHLDTTHGFFNGSSVFLLPAGFEDEKIELDILPPEGDEFAAWRVATGLKPARGTKRHAFGTYTAASYDELIDCPVEMGEFALASFKAHGVPHDVAISGRVPNLDMKRLCADLQRVCEVQIELFEPKTRAAPFERYTFMTLAVGDGYGGLEHRNSTALITKREDLPCTGMAETSDGYRQFLGLASHEYFHSWNVKRIRPAAFVPYELAEEAHTRLLWLFEGFTSYYDDLMLLRAGLITEAQYLELLAKTFTSVLGASGRHKQSVAESSFDAWIKYYRQDENSPNAIVSYYQKGSLVALLLDLTIRSQTAGKKSLDDVMRALWAQHQEAGADYAGLGEDDFVEVVFDATGLDLGQFVAELTEGTEDPDYAGLLADFGVSLSTAPESLVRTRLGVKLATEGEARLSHVYDGGAAQAAGLSGGDVIIAIDGLRAPAAKVEVMLGRYRAGQSVAIAAFRRDELMNFSLSLSDEGPAKITLAAGGKNKLRAGWLA